VRAVANRTPERAVAAFAHAGVAPGDVRVCTSAAEAQEAFDRGRCVVVPNAPLLLGLPLDVLVEGTGDPEVGARNAEAAIAHGLHVAMVSKEADSVVGPILCARARRRGLVYTAVEGDQPSLLIGLITWSRALGMEIVAAGKSSEYDFVFDPQTQTVASRDKAVCVPDFGDLWRMGERPAADVVAARSTLLASLPQRAVPDLCEMGIVANATGLKPDNARFHAPVARTLEITDVLCPAARGGLLAGTGILDVVNCLRRPDEASLGGGVFVVVACHDAKSWQVLEAKGHPVSRDGGRALVYHPGHLLGLEAPISVLTAALRQQATGAEELRPVCDLVARATRDLKAGTRLEIRGHHHTIDGTEGLLVDGFRAGGGNPLPYYMLGDAVLRRDVPAGTVITGDAVHPPEHAALGRLRKEQDQHFGAGDFNPESIQGL
jgi:predicted homoserine dehydrogenase-like protein